MFLSGRLLGVLCLGAHFLLCQSTESQELTLNPLFGSHAVLQCGMAVPVWGTAKPGDQVSISFAGQNVTARAGADGKWKTQLDPMKVSAEPARMTIKSGSKEIVLEDVLVGEVWLVCGRSNIGFGVGGMTNGKQEIEKAAQPLLRLFRVGTKDPSPTPLDSFTTKGWTESSPQTAGGFSAVGWVFGSELQKARNVPVGIVMSSWGGSPASFWIESSYLDSHRKGGARTAPVRKPVAPPARQSLTTGTAPAATSPAYLPGCCFNSHIHPLIPMAMKGAVIFFDCSPAEEISMLADNWRKLWGAGNFPYIYIQVHRQGGPVEEDPNKAGGDSSRAEYVPLMKTIPNSAMVVALDTGVEGERNIHPPNKRPVGERVALAARALAYGEKIVYSGPIFSSATMEGNRAIISFDHVGGGLEAKGGPLEGFAGTEDGKTWSWGEAAIRDGKVIVTFPGLKQVKTVRYAFASSNPKGNLYNKEGLPASPFSSTFQ